MTTWAQVLSWRMRRQFLTDHDADSPVDVARRLCGVQAQVAGPAALAVALRRRTPDLGGTATALARRDLLRTWAVRGTLHLLPPDLAPSVLSLCAQARSWHKGVWQKEFATLDQMEALATAVSDVLAGGDALTREDLVAHVRERTGDDHLADQLASGWGTVMKPLAWQGLLANGPGDDGVTFIGPASFFPGWTLPDPDDAAPVVIDAYLGAYGPASPETFGAWLLRGATPKARLRKWFATMTDDGRLVPVDVEGEALLARAQDVEALEAERPAGVVRLVGSYDQAVLGPGTAEGHVVPGRHRGQVSLPGGRISPVVLLDGLVVGTWAASDGKITTTLFAPVPQDGLAAGTGRVEAVLAP